ncbi:MLO-like protein 11 isoform X2 [Cryptomeria japonica]|uniref:MLO-like protein 11 isoform X2 n=1 Tax=Cryptomeria japonica TaxID=3369 RepID=UPI0027DA58DA|nr:MLO-like protein 11 isoform X2 [Cryptomeria japonica]
MAEDMVTKEDEVRSLALTPTWSVAVVLTVFVLVSLVVERSIHRLSHWLHVTKRKPLFHALENMKSELMLLGFISLMLAATSSLISSICIPSKYYKKFSPCDDEDTKGEAGVRKLLGLIHAGSSSRRFLSSGDANNTCKDDSEPFVSFEGLEQLHRFIFVMAITHVFYSCLTMLLAIVKIYTWSKWETQAQSDTHENITELSRTLTMRRQSTFVKYHTEGSWSRNRFFVWMNHNLPFKYDFHSYMIRSVEDEFKQIVGISAPLWGFVIAFMLFNVKGTNLYFWIAFIPIVLVLIVGAKLQHVIATLALENVTGSGHLTGSKIKPRDELFWFNKPELLLSLIHFILFQNAFELASFFWFWWQFGYNSCYLKNHKLVYVRLVLGFAGQFLCSFSTLPLHALVSQMGTNFKAALLPPRVRETIHGWGKEAKRRRRRGTVTDESYTRTTVGSSEDTYTVNHDEIYGDRFSLSHNSHQNGHIGTNNSIEIELQTETHTSVSPYSDSHIHTVTQQRSLSLLPSQSHEPRYDAINLARSFTQPVSRQ